MSVKLLAELRPAGNFPVAETSDIQHGNKRLNTVLSDIETVNESKADKTYVDSQLATKASTTALTEGLATKANTADVTSSLAGKADNSTVSALTSRVSTNETNIAAQTSRIDKLSTFISPEMFGAVGDGVTDDTNAFESAMNYASNHFGIPIILSDKTYFIRDGLHITNRGIVFIGSGNIHNDTTGEALGTVIKSNNNQYTVWVDEYDIKIKGVSVKDSNYGFLVRNLYNSNLSPSYGCTFEQCHAYNCEQAGFMIEAGVNCKFDFCTATKCNIGFKMPNGISVNSTSVEFTHCWSRDVEYCGFLVTTSNYCTLQNCLCDISGNYAYVVENSNGITMDCCGGEYVKCLIALTNVDGITITSPSAYMCNEENDKLASIVISNTSKNVVITGATSKYDGGSNQIYSDNDGVIILSSNVKSNTNNGIDFVTHTYNGDDGWYRKYVSGWIEQGGTIEVEGNVETFVSLLVPFKDTSYTVVKNYIGESFEETVTPAMYFVVNSLSVMHMRKDAFSVYIRNDYSLNKISWYACGFMQ